MPPTDPVLLASLAGLSFATSLITATFSLGGGTLMVAALALVFPGPIVVPLHGVIQLGSNAGRAFVQRAHIQWRLVGWIALGGVLGSVAGGTVATTIPAPLVGLAIGLFVLVTAWVPLPQVIGRSALVQVAGGAVISALGMVVGAVGPVVAVFIKGLADRRQLVATHAALMTIQNIAKVATFVALGFAFSDWLPLIALMVGAGLLGTALGSRLLLKVPERLFRLGFRIVLSLVALDLIRAGLTG